MKVLHFPGHLKYYITLHSFKHKLPQSITLALRIFVWHIDLSLYSNSKIKTFSPLKIMTQLFISLLDILIHVYIIQVIVANKITWTKNILWSYVLQTLNSPFTDLFHFSFELFSLEECYEHLFIYTLTLSDRKQQRLESSPTIRSMKSKYCYGTKSTMYRNVLNQAILICNVLYSILLHTWCSISWHVTHNVV